MIYKHLKQCNTGKDLEFHNTFQFFVLKVIQIVFTDNPVEENNIMLKF
jgi:hypothetical protein